MKSQLTLLVFFIALLLPPAAMGKVSSMKRYASLPAGAYAVSQPGYSGIIMNNTLHFFSGKKGRSFFLNRVAEKLLQFKSRRIMSGQEKKPSRGLMPLIIGIAGIAMVFIPNLYFAALIFLVAAIHYGKRVKRKYPGDKKAETAVGLGWAGLVLLAGALLLSVFGSMNYLRFD